MSYSALYLANFWFQSQVAGTNFHRVRRPLEGGGSGEEEAGRKGGL